MAYCTQTDIEARTSYGADESKQAGTAMTAEQWASYCTSLIAEVTGAINRFCRRASFEAATYTDLYDGRGCSGDRGEYLETDRIFLLREQPVSSIMTVKVDISDQNQVPVWVTRTPRSAEAVGDYGLVTRGPVSYLRFHNNVPRGGLNNVEITYVAGYAAGDPALDDIRGIALDIISQHLGRKKRLQEAIAARRLGTPDAAEMTPPAEPELTLTPDIKRRLAAYRRGPRIGRCYR